MILKEAYRYQNYLDELIMSAETYLGNRDFYTSTKEEHLRSKANPDAEDETTEESECANLGFKPNDVIDFIVKLITEKQSLTEAIADTKRKLDIDIDGAIAMNKTKQMLINTFGRLAKFKPAEITCNGSDYKFDINGEQKKYYYTIKKTQSILYDRNDVRELIKKYRKECDDVSQKHDLYLVTAEVEFTPTWEIGDTLEEILGN